MPSLLHIMEHCVDRVQVNKSSVLKSRSLRQGRPHKCDAHIHASLPLLHNQPCVLYHMGKKKKDGVKTGTLKWTTFSKFIPLEDFGIEFLDIKKYTDKKLGQHNTIRKLAPTCFSKIFQTPQKHSEHLFPIKMIAPLAIFCEIQLILHFHWL